MLNSLASCVFIGFISFSISSPANALSITEAYSLAVRNDPNYRASLMDKEAGDEYKNIGISGFLPKVSLNYHNTPKHWQDQKALRRDILGNLSEESRRGKYNSSQTSVSLVQPLFDYEAYANYKSALAKKSIADERFRGNHLELAVRVINAYIDVVYSREQFYLASARKDAYKERLDLNQRLFRSGEGTITDVSETQARLSLAEAELLEAKDDYDISIRELEMIIGGNISKYGELNSLNHKVFYVFPLVPTSFEKWKKIALENNPLLRSLHHEIDVAKYEIEASRAGFMPKVQFLAMHSENKFSGYGGGQKNREDSIGIEVNFPIYSGGVTSALTRQAAARYGKAKHDMDAQVNSIYNRLRKDFNTCVSSSTKIAAFDMAVKSAKMQVTSTKKSVIAGQRVNLDILNAEQQLYSAQRDLAYAKYSFIKSWVSLKNNSGTLSEKDVHRVAALFK